MSSVPTHVNPFATIEELPLDDFMPRPAPLTPAAPDSVRAATKTTEKRKLTELAESSGFTTDNYREVPLPGRIPKEVKETFTKTIRFNISDWNKFADWCHANNHTIIRGFELLTEHLPRPKKK